MLNNVSYYNPHRDSRRNILINGNFDVWQRGNDFLSVADNRLTADRWLYLFSTPYSDGAQFNIQKSTNVPNVAQSGSFSSNSLRITVAAQNAGVYSQGFFFDNHYYMCLEQIVEGYDFQRIAGKDMTLSFWVGGGDATGTASIYIQNSDRSVCFIKRFEVTTGWTKVVVNIPGAPLYAGTWNFTNGAGLRVGFCFGAATDFVTTPEYESQWLYGDGRGIVGVDDFSKNNIGSFFCISQVQLEEGSLNSVQIYFDNIPFHEEFLLCERYFEKSFQNSQIPTDSTTVNGASWARTGAVTSPAFEFSKVRFNVRKRTTPTIILYNPVSPTTIWDIRNRTNNTEVPGTVVYSGETGFVPKCINSFNPINPGNEMGVHWTANAEIEGT